MWGAGSSRFCWRKMLVRNWHCCDVSWIPFTSCFLGKSSEKNVNSNHIIGLGCPICEFVPMLFITGVDSLAKTITKSADFYSKRKLWGFNITKRKTHFAKTNSLSMTVFATKISCNSVTTIKTMKNRVFIRHCLRDFETQLRFWKRTEKITKDNKGGNKDKR